MVVAIAKNAKGLPSAKVVWIAHTNHYAFRPPRSGCDPRDKHFHSRFAPTETHEWAELSGPKRDRARNVASEVSPFQAVG